MINYDKTLIKEQLETEDVFQLLLEFGGEPEYSSFGIISETICHNLPGEGSRKLYFYNNTKGFQCYTGCDFFDIYELVCKVANLQWHETFELNDAVRWIANRFGISGAYEEDKDKKLEDWKIFSRYDKIKTENKEEKKSLIQLKEFNSNILNNFNSNIIIQPWINEGIGARIMDLAQIKYYPGKDQIVIPHFDKDNRLIGIRGRTMIAEEAEKYGKYRPLKVNNLLYNHPLGMNLYGYNWNKINISIIKKVIIFESEKAVLQYASYFGWDNNISVSCCGSSISNYQMSLLLELGVEEIIVAFDRQFQELNDKECKHLIKQYEKLNNKYHNYVNMSFIFDKKMITSYKASPIDEGLEKFLILFKERVRIG